jgi:hypothetical protein
MLANKSVTVACDNVTGRLHPAVGIAEKAKVRVNLGQKPFKWSPGDTLSFEAQDEEKNEGTETKPRLFRSKSVAVM